MSTASGDTLAEAQRVPNENGRGDRLPAGFYRRDIRLARVCPEKTGLLRISLALTGGLSPGPEEFSHHLEIWSVPNVG